MIVLPDLLFSIMSLVFRDYLAGPYYLFAAAVTVIMEFLAFMPFVTFKLACPKVRCLIYAYSLLQPNRGILALSR